MYFSFISLSDQWKHDIDLLRLNPIQVKLKKKQLPNLIDQKAGEMEIGLSLLGATAIEDKLQVGVPGMKFINLFS